MQITLDLELDRAAEPAQDRITNIVTHVLVQDQRQVAVHPVAFGTRQIAPQVQYAREFSSAHRLGGVAGMPFELQIAVGVRIAETQVGKLHLHLAAVDLPRHVGRKLGKRHHRIFKHARHRDASVVQTELGFTRQLGEIDIDRGAADSRRPQRHARTRQSSRSGQRLNMQLLNPGLNLVLRDCTGGALPAGLDTLHQPGGSIARQRRMQGGAQRQAAGNLCQRRQVEPVRLQLTVCRPCGVALRLRQLQVAAWPAQSVSGIKRQTLGRKFQTSGRKFARQPS